MADLQISADLDQSPWTDLDLAAVQHGQVERIGLLRNGTSGGRASVALVIRLDDGTVTIAETTWRLFRTAALALNATPTASEEAD